MSGPDRDFLALYERSVDDVYRYASRLTGGDRAATEELVQDTYLAALQHMRHGPQPDLTTGYLIIICRNRFLDTIRSDARRHRREDRSQHLAEPVRRVEPDPPDPSTTAALAALPADHRAALVLRYVDDLPVADVAHLLGRSVHATESLLARARTAMRERLPAPPSKGAAS